MKAEESHTWQEIVSQPQVWRATLDAFEANRYIYPPCSAWLSPGGGERIGSGPATEPDGCGDAVKKNWTFGFNLVWVLGPLRFAGEALL